MNSCSPDFLCIAYTLRVPVYGGFYPNEGNMYRKVGLADCGNDFSDTL